MVRSFDEWIKSLPIELKKRYEFDKKPPLSIVNYIWVSNLINNESIQSIPSVEELVDWIKTEQVNAKKN